jgi:hypothetical protein
VEACHDRLGVVPGGRREGGSERNGAFGAPRGHSPETRDGEGGGERLDAAQDEGLEQRRANGKKHRFQSFAPPLQLHVRFHIAMFEELPQPGAGRRCQRMLLPRAAAPAWH